ncbi:MAG: hypothetical protein KME16_18010 [Scytolyngbya sp. HA4215-MV1]|nr:hypothetical protein [Scytolyngbya sp. HA4215-MV1]
MAVIAHLEIGQKRGSMQDKPPIVRILRPVCRIQQLQLLLLWGLGA